MKNPSKHELQNIAFDNSLDIEYKNNCTPKYIYFLVIDTTLASDNPLRSKRNLVERV